LYANSTTDPTNVTLWTRDFALPTPGQLQSQSDPYPVHRVAYNSAGQFVDAIDLYYTGLLSGPQQAETLMTPHPIGLNGGLTVMALPKVDNELMARQGSSQTWASRDLAWVYQVTLANGDRDYVDAAGVPPYVITLTRADGTVIPRVNLGRPTYDQATGRL